METDEALKKVNALERFLASTKKSCGEEHPITKQIQTLLEEARPRRNESASDGSGTEAPPTIDAVAIKRMRDAWVGATKRRRQQSAPY